MHDSDAYRWRASDPVVCLWIYRVLAFTLGYMVPCAIFLTLDVWQLWCSVHEYYWVTLLFTATTKWQLLSHGFFFLLGAREVTKVLFSSFPTVFWSFNIIAPVLHVRKLMARDSWSCSGQVISLVLEVKAPGFNYWTILTADAHVLCYKRLWTCVLNHITLELVPWNDLQE